MGRRRGEIQDFGGLLEQGFGLFRKVWEEAFNRLQKTKEVLLGFGFQ
ncbi:hypothetical protein RchiOBHm_Chr3g0453531 [Rosa chinensis]|uniref:Uncharacterized protein n=1 Tax=Rosa chinensis TaxID=74649 RepID=A0A2P6R6K8_ROSCH|nr:hypothetical protein RchiOBHm_Chr3g0453531 [Rosa chinensis]